MYKLALFAGRKIQEDPSLLLNPLTWIAGATLLIGYAIKEHRIKKTAR